MSSKRYGKYSSSLLNQTHRKSFLEENSKHVEKQNRIAELYKKQPKREKCKNCDNKLTLNADFVKLGLGYELCDQCHHLNGIYEDTDEFCNALYESDSGQKDYAETYKSNSLEEYNYRTTSIYIPKAEFLYTSLLDNGVDPNKLKYFDFGAGSGYFVAALKKIGLDSVLGSEVSKSQVEFGNAMIGENLLSIGDIKDTKKIVGENEAQVVSMIGVLEHLQDPREVFNQIKHNKNVDYIYISVPTFGLSVYLEMMSSEILHLQLQGGHTHLYTEKSLSHVCKEFGFKIISEWWFGTDVVDLFRHISFTLEKSNTSERLRDLWNSDFLDIIDPMQLEIDKKHFSSEVHMILKKI